MLGLWETSGVSPRHFAFRVADEHVDQLRPFLAKRGIEIVEDFGTAPAEQPVVHPWIPAAAIYFEDSDGNELELIAMLSDDL